MIFLELHEKLSHTFAFMGNEGHSPITVDDVLPNFHPPSSAGNFPAIKLAMLLKRCSTLFECCHRRHFLCNLKKYWFFVMERGWLPGNFIDWQDERNNRMRLLHRRKIRRYKWLILFEFHVKKFKTLSLLEEWGTCYRIIL